MSNTLRRKMFKLGGEVSKSHGVGLTHGLKFNKGGNVAPEGSNVYPKVMGPDGQMREGHNVGMLKAALPYLAMGASSLKGGIQSAMKGSKALKNYFNPRSKATSVSYGMPAGFVRADKIARTGLGSLRPSSRMSPDTLTSLSRIVGTGVGAGATAGLASAPFLRNEDPTSGAGRALETMRGLGEGALDLSTGLPVYGSQAIANFFRDDENKKETKGTTQLIREALRGKQPETKKPDEVITTETDNYVNMKSDAEKRAEMMYKAMGGGANFDYSTVSNALLQAAPFVAEGEYAKALTAAGTSVNNEVAADKELQQQISGTIIEQEIAQDMADDDAIRKLVAGGEVDTAMEARRLLNAYDQSEDVAKAEYDNKDQLDVEIMTVGKVYTDVKNASGDLYVVKNSSGQVQSFNRYEEALAYAET